MEKKKKGILIFSLIVIGLGVVLFIAGLVWFLAGDNLSVRQIEAYDIDEILDAENVTDLDLNLNIGTFNIKTGGTDKIEITGKSVEEGLFDFNVSNDTLEITSSQYKWYRNIGYQKNNVLNDFEIRIPDKEYSNVTINCGVGELEITGLTADNLDLDGGVGEIILNRCRFGESNIDAGVGEINFSGELYGDMDLSMGVGSAEFEINGPRENYDIKSEGFIDISIESSKTYTDNYYTNDLPQYNNKGKIKINVDSGVGETKFKFIN